MALAPSSNDQSGYPIRRRNVQRRDGSNPRLQTRNRLLRFKDDALPRSTIMYQVPPDDGDGSIRKTNRDLRQVVQSRYGGYLGRNVN